MQVYKIIGPIFLILGMAGAVFFAAIFLVRNYRDSVSLAIDSITRSKEAGEKMGARVLNQRAWVWVLMLIIVLGGSVLRLNDLDKKTLSHPEVYVPGIELPKDISEPPRRTEIVPLIHFHFHSEPHPPAYYFLMYGWTKIFGTSLFAMRLPSVLFGILSIVLIFLVGKELFTARTGVIAAAMLSLNGHHFFWSQNARMYAMACFLGLLSTFLLIKLFKRPTDLRFYLIAAGYLGVTVFGVYTEILFWVLLAGQMVFAFLYSSFDQQNAPKFSSGLILCIQSIVLMIGTPMWAHAVYTGRTSPIEPLSLVFLGEFFSFGFLFERDWAADPIWFIPVWLTLASVLSFLLLAALCLSCRREDKLEVFDRDHVPFKTVGLLPIAICSAASVLGFVILTSKRQVPILLTLLVILGGFLMPRFAVYLRANMPESIHRIVHRRFFSSGRFLLFLLSFFSLALVSAVSVFNSLLASRLFLVFTPYLLLLAAGGFRTLKNRPLAWIPLAAALACFFSTSVYLYSGYPNEVVDYKKAAASMLASTEEGDLFFVHDRSWVTTPIFYYLGNDRVKFVANDYEIASKGTQRIWMINIVGQPSTPEMLKAVESFEITSRKNFLRCEILLYERKSEQTILNR